MSGTGEGRPARARPRRDGSEQVEPTAAAAIPSWDAIDKARAIVEAALDLKAEQIVALDMRPLSSFADVFVIASGRSDRHVRSIAEAVARRLHELGDAPLGMEGQQEGRWVLIDANDVFVCTTVILETEWVLRGAYGFSADQCAKALANFAGLPRVTLEDAAAVAKALGWMAQGVDFADGLHLAKAEGCHAFVTFDQGFAKAANALGGLKVRAP